MLVLDSEKNLPPNWKTLDIAEEYGSIVKNFLGDEEEQLLRKLKEHDDTISKDNVEGQKQRKLPKRVLVYTSVILLTLFILAKKASVDGTFKVIIKINYFAIEVFTIPMQIFIV